MLTSLYQETILDHYRRPRNRGSLPNADTAVELRNPLCGDVVTVMLRLGEDGRVAEATFEAEGCSIARASASMLTEVVRGLTTDEVRALELRVRALLAGEPVDESPPPLPGDLVALGAVSRFPARVKCASMPWDSLAAGLARHDGVGRQ